MYLYKEMQIIFLNSLQNNEQSTNDNCHLFCYTLKYN